VTDEDSAVEGRCVQTNTYLQQRTATRHTDPQYQALKVSSFTSWNAGKLNIALERQDVSCTYLAHHELESNFLVIIIILFSKILV